MGYASATCGVDERILYRAHYHWLYWMSGVLLTAAPLVALAIWPTTTWSTVLALCLTLLLVPFGLVILVRTLSSEIIVTNDRFIRKCGLVSFEAEDISLDRIEEIDLKESLLGAIFGYGTLEVHGSGKGVIVAKMIQAPERLRRAIETAGESAPPPSAPRPASGLVQVAVALIAAFALFDADRAAANDAAERFAQRLIDEGFAILRDDSASTTLRRERFRAFIVQHIEARKTALFTLGVYRRGAPPEVLSAFVDTFRDYTIAIYEARLDDYRHATLKVVNSVENKPGDITVNTRGEDPSLREPVSIAFRLTGIALPFKIVDVQVEGIWLSMEQREQFTSLLGQNGGDIAALTVELKKRTERIRVEARPA